MQQQSGLFWHVHHGDGVLVEWCYDYDRRAQYIGALKPPDEQKLRFRLFQPVQGQLPQEVVEAGKVYAEARKAKALEIVETFIGLLRARYVGWKALNEARKAYLEVLANHKDEIEALHSQECFDDCPWNGETILSAA